MSLFRVLSYRADKAVGYKQIAQKKCGNSDYIINIIGRESVVINFLSDDEKANFLLGEVNKNSVIKTFSRNSWLYEDIKNFKGKSLLESSENDYLFSDSSLAKYDGKKVILCLEKKGTTREIFSATLRKITSVTTIE